MVNEKRVSESVNSIISASPSRLKKYLESDSEILAIENVRYLFTIDEFSSEDMFHDKYPYPLGWNIATGGSATSLPQVELPCFMHIPWVSIISGMRISLRRFAMVLPMS